MEYCTFHFEVIYEDGNSLEGTVPYRGQSIQHEELVTFVKGFFAGTKPYHDADIHVQLLKVYDEPKEWLEDVKPWETFKFLKSVNNFAGDHMHKYFPDE